MSEELFPLKKKADLIKHFGKIFSPNLECDSEIDNEILEEDLVGYMDAANVCMIIPKKKNFKVFLESTFELKPISKIPNLIYEPNIKDGPSKSKFSCEYFKIILELSKHYETMTLEVKNDYPLRVTTTDFIYILSPRVAND